MRRLWVGAVLLLVALFVAALAVGAVAIPVRSLWTSEIVRAVRLPRAVLAVLVFYMIRLIPGDPVLTMLGIQATPDAVAQLVRIRPRACCRQRHGARCGARQS